MRPGTIVALAMIDRDQVEADWLLEHGRTREEVARMQAAASGLVVWVVSSGYDYEGDDVQSVWLSRDEAIAAAVRNADSDVFSGESFIEENREGAWSMRRGSAYWTVSRWTVE